MNSSSMLIRWGWCAGCALVALLLARPAHAQLASLETAGLRLVYFTATESYLVPHAARTFLNSLAFQRRLFGLDPEEARHGPAGRLLRRRQRRPPTVVPRNNLTRGDCAAQLRVRDDRRPTSG